MSPKKREDPSLGDLFENFAIGLNKAATRPDVNGYMPHEKQKMFHSSRKKGRLYIGGNRSGKSVGGVVEDIWWLTGKHPYRETPSPPVRGRLVTVDYPNGWVKIIKPILTQWIPPSSLIDGSWEASWSEREKRLTLANGSFMEIMNYEQELDAFAGASRHFIHFDEEPPKAIFNECKMRLMDTGGHWHITMTPVEGMTWVFEDIYEPGIKGTDPRIDVIEVDVTENTYLSPVEIEDALFGLDEEEMKARKSGKFVQMGGLVFKKFNPEYHVIAGPKFRPRNTVLGASIDHGYNNPTAFLVHMVTQDNIVFTFLEHYRSEWTIAQHANKILEMQRQLRENGRFLGRDEILDVWCDPAMRQRNAVNGNSIQLEYRQHGIPMIPSNNDVKAGIGRMMNYLNHGRWFIADTCPNLIRELRRYKWKTRESRKLQEKHGKFDEPDKKDDHAVDAARYFFMSIPDLKPDQLTIPSNQELRDRVASILQGKVPYNVYTGNFDTQLLGPDKSEFKISTDEYMGGEW